MSKLDVCINYTFNCFRHGGNHKICFYFLLVQDSFDNNHRLGNRGRLQHVGFPRPHAGATFATIRSVDKPNWTCVPVVFQSVWYI